MTTSTPLIDRISQLRKQTTLSRTVSGTYISRISKQPTPEPSEADDYSHAFPSLDIDDAGFEGGDNTDAPFDLDEPLTPLPETSDPNAEVALLQKRIQELELNVSNFISLSILFTDTCALGAGSGKHCSGEASRCAKYG